MVTPSRPENRAHVTATAYLGGSLVALLRHAQKRWTGLHFSEPIDGGLSFHTTPRTRSSKATPDLLIFSFGGALIRAKNM